MTSSSIPKTGNVDLDKWIQAADWRFTNYISTLEVPVSKSGIISNYVHGKHPSKQLTVGASAYFGFIAPNSLAEIKEVTIRFIPTTTGTINYTINLSYGAVGEDENANTATFSVTTMSVTDDQIMELDLTYLASGASTGIWDAIDANDQIGVELVLDAAATTTDIQVLSLYFKYI